MTCIADKRQGELGGNTSTGLLKLLALAFMLSDHMGKMCFPAVAEMRILGRLAFPLYCWCMVVGACYTRSMPRYLLRLGLVGLISQPVYMVALNHPWYVPNIFLTLLVGLCGVWGMRAKRWGSQFWAPVLAMMAAVVLNCGSASYGWKGVLLLMLLYAARGSRKTIAAVMIAFCLYWGSGSSSVQSIFGLSLVQLRRGTFSALITPWLQLQTLAILSLPLIIWPDEIRLALPQLAGEKHTGVTLRTRMPGLRMPAWLGYAIYPGHLALLIGLEYMMGKTVHWEHLTNAWNQFIALF
ncbi:MAG: hypothetical protein IJE07_13245 [Clostridia bacterium]|nr:hypothetical protein [Clostridia bacterium]